MAYIEEIFLIISAYMADFTLLNSVEVYAAREKNGVYIPKERYYQEESERKVIVYYLFLM